GDFDYLLGRWRFTAEGKRYRHYVGLWTAVRLEGGATVLDEFRPMSDSGETYGFLTTLRVYNATADRWEVVTADGSNGLANLGTAQKVGDEVHLEQTFTGADGTAEISRVRYYNIRPGAFSWTSERSMDGGRTWIPDWLRIEATRIGPPPELAPLT